MPWPIKYIRLSSLQSHVIILLYNDLFNRIKSGYGAMESIMLIKSMSEKLIIYRVLAFLCNIFLLWDNRIIWLQWLRYNLKILHVSLYNYTTIFTYNMNNKYYTLLIHVLFVSIQTGDGGMQFVGAQHKERSA